MRSLTGGVCIKLLTKLRDNPIRSPLAVGGKAALLNEKIARGRLLVLPLCLIAPKFLANGLGPGTSQPAPDATRPAAKGQRFHVPQHRANPQTRLLNETRRFISLLNTFL
jgi:hypothetical protein